MGAVEKFHQSFMPCYQISDSYCLSLQASTNQTVNSQDVLTDVHIYRMSLPEHECPWGLKAIALLEDRQIKFEDHRLTTQDDVDDFKIKHDVATTPQIFFGTKRIGGYTDLAKHLGVKPDPADTSYSPVVAVFGTTLLMALVLNIDVVRLFMGFSICTLAMLKLMDVNAFAASFIKYDLISQRWQLWARIYPGVELLIGLGFLLTPPSALAGWVALLVGLPGMASVLKAVYVDKLALNCACIGGNSKTPLGIVSFSEYAIQTAMGFLVALHLVG